MPGFMSGASVADGTITSAKLADNAVTLAKMAGGTDGNLIGMDASGDPAYIATGSDGQVLTSGGAGVAAVMEGVAGGGFGFVETLTASADTTMTFAHTVAAGYDYEVVCRNINNTADIAGGNVTIQLGIGGGPTFQTSGYTSQCISVTGTTVTAVQDMATDGLSFDQNGLGGTGGATELWNMRMTILNPGAAEQTSAFSRLGNDDDGPVLEMHNAVSRWETATAITGIRVNTDASNFETGTFLLFRRVIS